MEKEREGAAAQHHDLARRQRGACWWIVFFTWLNALECIPVRLDRFQDAFRVLVITAYFERKKRKKETSCSSVRVTEEQHLSC